MSALSPETREVIRRKGLWSMADAAAFIGVHRTQLYNLWHRGEIHVTKQGRRSYIAADDLIDYLTRLQRDQVSA